MLLWRFHRADGAGRCFPSYERIAAAAKCCRDSVAVAVATLEDAGILTWVNRLTRIRHREQDLLGAWGWVWQVIRTSSGSGFSTRSTASLAAGVGVNRKIRHQPAH